MEASASPKFSSERNTSPLTFKTISVILIDAINRRKLMLNTINLDGLTATPSREARAGHGEENCPAYRHSHAQAINTYARDGCANFLNRHGRPDKFSTLLLSKRCVGLLRVKLDDQLGVDVEVNLITIGKSSTVPWSLSRLSSIQPGTAACSEANRLFDGEKIWF